MIDWWLFFASNVLVITMAFHTYLAYLCDKAKGRNVDTGVFKIPKMLMLGNRLKAKRAAAAANEVSPQTISVSSGDGVRRSPVHGRHLMDNGRLEVEDEGEIEPEKVNCF